MNNYLVTVTFTGDYFSLTTCVNAPDTDTAIIYAQQLLKDHHGIDVEAAGAWDVETQLDGEFV